MSLTPAEHALALQHAIECVSGLPMPTAARHVALDALREKLADVLAPVPIVFRPFEDGCDEWVIGPADAPRRFRSSLVGLVAAHLAIRGDAELRTAPFASPGAAHADTIVRRAIRDTAAGWVERTTGCLALASAMRQIRVEHGAVLYAPAAGSPPILTRR